MAQLAKKAVEAEKQTSYLLDVKEAQTRLTEKLAEVCKDYYNLKWDETFNVAGVPIDSA